MSDGPVLVADFDLGGLALAELPSGQALVSAASERGAKWLAVDVHETADGWAVVHPGEEVAVRGGEVCDVDDLTLAETKRVVLRSGSLNTLEEVLLTAHRQGLGLALRIARGATIRPVDAALGVMGLDSHAAMRTRFLVVVRTRKVGERLRAEAPNLPSAFEIEPDSRGPHAWLRRRFPNLARAGAAADDLCLPLGLLPDAHVRDRLLPHLARRSACLWLTHVTEADLEHAASLGAHGFFIRWKFPV